MKTLNLLFMTIGLIPSIAFASFKERAAEAYLKTDRNFDIDCYYSYNKSFKLITPVSETQKDSQSISRDFVIETPQSTVPLHFALNRVENSFNYSVLIDNKHLSSGKLGKREFYIAPIKDIKFAGEFETSKIFCKVNFAYAYPFTLEDGNYHFSVHPHKTYDWQSLLKDKIEVYLNDPDFNSIILLETGNYRGNLVNIHHFLDGVDYKLPFTDVDSDLEAVPENVPLIVSPAGNSRYDFQVKKELNITFTGGNHNYCIWNATRHVIHSLMESKSEAKINFLYDTNAIVAQVRGIDGGLNFPRRNVNRSNLLKDLLSSSESRDYHMSYLRYFSGFLARQFAGMYKTYTIHYHAEGFQTTVTLQGTGLRDLEVSLTYF